MQVQKISFTCAPQGKNRSEGNQSSLYNKQNFIQIGAINDFIAGSAVGFGILESRDKFKLLKKENVLPAALKEIAKKQTKHNILLGLGIGALYTAADLALMHKLMPKMEKMYDKIDEMKNQK